MAAVLYRQKLRCIHVSGSFYLLLSGHWFKEDYLYHTCASYGFRVHSPYFRSGFFMIIAGQLFKSAQIRRVLPAAFPAVEVSSYDQLMAFIGSSVGEDRRMRFGKWFNITESDNINFFSQSDKLLIIMEDGIGIFKLAGSNLFSCNYCLRRSRALRCLQM